MTERDKLPLSDSRAPVVPVVPTPDAPPTRPEKPLSFDCCESGCDRCVFDIYAEEMQQYEDELAAWRTRNPGCDPDARENGRQGR